METSSAVLSVVNQLIAKGDIEKQGDILLLTKRGRTEAAMRWRGLCNEAQILCSLWLKEQWDSVKKGG